jgi:acyl-CoA synthetase (AMP-forming)/AMP-acid ligase II
VISQTHHVKQMRILTPRTVTLLAILAARSVAVPLSPAFPAPELQYILDHSEASLLLSSAKFAAKAEEVMVTQLASKPTLVELTKFLGGGDHQDVELASTDPGRAGMMLYTSGTTNRPVCTRRIGQCLPRELTRASRKGCCSPSMS